MNTLKTFYSFALLTLLTLSLLMAACGDTAPQVAGPPPSPTPGLKQETDRDLFFVMSVPISWVKNSDKEAANFVAPDDPNLKMSVSVAQVTRLTADSTRILQEKLDSIKGRYPQARQDNAGQLTLVDNTVALSKISYVENNLEITEYLAQVNVPKADRAYILQGRSPAVSAEQRKTIFLTSFESFKANPPLTVPATLTAAAQGDPAVALASAGGKVSGNKTIPGKVATQVEWQSPPLLYGPNRFVVSGYFPRDWQWQAKSFPTLDRTALAITPKSSLANPGLYFTAPNNEALLQLGIVPEVFRNEDPPSSEEYLKAIDPYLKTFSQSITGLGSRTTITDLANVGTFFRTTFIVRSDSGATSSRGVVLFRSAGRHLVMGVITLNAQASLKQELIDGYDIDLQSIISSVKVSN